MNGQRFDFFKSKNGLIQGDPISSSLFVLSAEILSAMLNNLQNRRGFTGFYINRVGPHVNHLAFADDLILFSSGTRKTIKIVMKTLEKYEAISRQPINISKSCVMLAPGASASARRRVTKYMCIQLKNFSIKYLGCPLI